MHYAIVVTQSKCTVIRSQYSKILFTESMF